MADHSSKNRFRTQKVQHQSKRKYNDFLDTKRTDKEKWGEKILHDFKKIKRKEEMQQGTVDMKKLYETLNEQPRTQPSSSRQSTESFPLERLKKKKEASRFSKAQWEHRNKAEKKRQKYEELQQKKKEKEEALARYRQKKKARFVKLCKRTPKGQPVMKYQMEVLLEQLEKQHKERTSS